jgi:hypothetical protein
MVTFSRGGMITGLLMIVLLFHSYISSLITKCETQLYFQCDCSCYGSYFGDMLTKLADLLIKDMLTKMQQDGQRKSVYRKRRYF